MKNKIWLLQIPIVLFFTFLFWVTESGIQGDLKDPFLREKLFPNLRRFTGLFTDWKFHLRGAQPPRNKIIIVDIDSRSIEAIGRMPWHRDAYAFLISQVFASGAKAVGLDMVLSESDKRVPENVEKILHEKKLGHLLQGLETDPVLEAEIARHQDKVVTGWMTENLCQPAYHGKDCPMIDPDYAQVFPAQFEKFAYTSFKHAPGFDPSTTPLLTAPALLPNLDLYNAVSKHSGSFNAFPDADGIIRRTNVVLMVKGKPYPTLALELARVALKDELEVELNGEDRISALRFLKSGRQLPVSPLGVLDINFRGPGRTFQYVSALSVLGDEDQIEIERDRKIASASKKDLFQDAIVLIGVSAVGVYDMRAFPFDSNVPGVEGHANILDNILSNDFLTEGDYGTATLWIFGLMIIGALLFGIAAEKLDAIPGLLTVIGVIGGTALLDQRLLFNNGIHWNLSFLYAELVCLFVMTVSIKYVLEERNKKFIKGAFAKYVAPDIVDSMLKDPAKLVVGGEKRSITVLFSDIRGFTTFSEKLDAKVLSQFLNEYLGLMVDIVFEFKGNIDKFIGDAVMAYWGAPLDQPDHAANACKAAIKMQQVLAANRERFRSQYGVDVQIGIGVNSGVASIGNMGCEKIFSYTSLGDEVNLASRVEGLTKYYGCGVMVTHSTLEHVTSCSEPLPQHRPLDLVKVKGKKNAVELIELPVKALSPEGLRFFAQGRELYRKREWDQAIEKFKAAQALLQTDDEPDGPCRMYLERCEELKQSPPNADWDGSWEMTSK